MSEQKSKDKPAPKPETPSEKKQPETVQLSAEELRRISGGAAISNPPPKPR